MLRITKTDIELYVCCFVEFHTDVDMCVVSRRLTNTC